MGPKKNNECGCGFGSPRIHNGCGFGNASQTFFRNGTNGNMYLAPGINNCIPDTFRFGELSLNAKKKKKMSISKKMFNF